MLSAKAWPSRNRAYSSSVAINSLLRFILSEMYPATGDMNIPTRDIIPAMEEATVSSAPKSRAKLATRGKVICPAAPFARLIKISTKNFHVHRLVFASFTESPPASLFRRLFCAAALSIPVLATDCHSQKLTFIPKKCLLSVFIISKKHLGPLLKKRPVLLETCLFLKKAGPSLQERPVFSLVFLTAAGP